MKLRFLGTRGLTESRTARHRMHSSLLLAYRGNHLLIDWGEDWLEEVLRPRPAALLITHAHPDHAGGLKNGAPCPVVATAEAWREMKSFAIEDRRKALPRRPFSLAGFTIEAFPVVHSVRSPAVGYRIAAGRAALFYVPDVVYIPDRARALSGIDLYIGDGATLARSMVRKTPQGSLFGHTPVRTQLTWCQKEGVGRALITHCGSEIVRDEERAAVRLAAMAEERGILAELAYDGLEIVRR
ncbi:MAG: MBL fold metallo-hydrolase [Deltaproteobacteria bacterium]|jgi:phosphoribosyl 1,2-cyclic phosphodiesterase